MCFRLCSGSVYQATNIAKPAYRGIEIQASFERVPGANAPSWCVQETSMPEEAWPSLAEAYRLFLLGSGEQPEQLPSTPSNLRNGMLPASPSNAKAYLSNGPAALDQHHLISGDSRNSLKAASHPVGAAVTEPSEVDSDEALGTSVSQMDAELEAAVLDTLTETVLVSCANMPSKSRHPSHLFPWEIGLYVVPEAQICGEVEDMTYPSDGLPLWERPQWSGQIG